MLPQKYQKETISLAIRGTWIKPKVHSAIYGVLFWFIFVVVAMMKHWPKNSLKRKGSTRLPHPCHNPAQKEDKVRTEAETMEKYCLMDCVHGLLSLFSSATQEQLPRSGTTHRGFDTPTSTMKQENSPQKY